jgi:hypothetical protein
MVEDVRLAVEGRCPVAFHGRMGGMVPTPDEVVGALKALSGKVERTREREQQQKRHSGLLEDRTGGHRRATEAASRERTQGAEVGVRAGTRDGGER